ncbi:MAG: glycosyltransferase [Bacteroidetes bacterium]|nr:MAG: glycosyltransferase [Bacteroidota bacterium]
MNAVLITFWLCALFLYVRTAISVYNLFSRPLLQVGTPAAMPLVSVLIPARNEAHNLPVLFEQLQQLRYPGLEIIVLNDQSEDDTEAVLQRLTARDGRYRYLNGQPLPTGWLGKNWACHQLAREASGQYLLFLDADIAYLHPDMLTYCLPYMQQYQLALLSVFPDQIMGSMAERVVVPIMHYLLLSLLPLPLVFRAASPSLAAANGQFMLFERETYRAFQWHAQLKEVVIEDVGIMRRLKQQGLKGMTLLANGYIRCRMYHSYREGLAGFSKNLLAGFGSVPLLLLYLSLTLLLWPWLLVYLPLPYFLLPLGSLLLLRAAVSRLARQSLWQNWLLHPLQMGTLCLIAMLSLYQHWRKQSTWKGRNVSRA